MPRPPTVTSHHIFLAAVLLLVFGATAAATKKAPLKPVDINKATAAELQQVPGIGPEIAKAIVRLREKSGPFKRVEDLLAIRGISRRRLVEMRPYLTVAAYIKPKT